MCTIWIWVDLLFGAIKLITVMVFWHGRDSSMLQLFIWSGMMAENGLVEGKWGLQRWGGGQVVGEEGLWWEWWRVCGSGLLVQEEGQMGWVTWKSMGLFVGTKDDGIFQGGGGVRWAEREGWCEISWHCHITMIGLAFSDPPPANKAGKGLGGSKAISFCWSGQGRSRSSKVF